MRPKCASTQTLPEQYRAAQEQHDPLRGNGDRKGDQRENDEGDARLREYGGGVGNGQRLPEQDAAIATFAVQRVEAIEQPTIIAVSMSRPAMES